MSITTKIGLRKKIKGDNMKKWQIVAYPECDEGNLSKKGAVVDARDSEEALYKGFRMFPEYHEVSVFEIKEGK